MLDGFVYTYCNKFTVRTNLFFNRGHPARYKTTDQVFVDLRAAVKDFADLRPLDDLVEQLPPVQRDHAHEDGVLDEL